MEGFISDGVESPRSAATVLTTMQNYGIPIIHSNFAVEKVAILL